MPGKTEMIASFVDFERARLPASALGRLAALRAHHGVEAALHDRELWVRWTPGDDDVARALLPLPGCRLYGRQAGRWHAFGQALPAFDVPEELRFQPLAQVIFPAPVQTLSAAAFQVASAALTLRADETYRPTVALQCSLDLFLPWADSQPSRVLARYHAAIQGRRLIVLGKKLPWLEPGERFWGQSVLTPIGYRWRPRLAEADLRQALGVAESDLLVLRQDRGEIIARDSFGYLTHAALRIAAQGGGA
jgi:MoxR-vWA-beta-propeller ternary system domain bpX2